MNRIYNAGYYEDYFSISISNGNGYLDKEKYYPFFDKIAERLIKDYRPQTVLDAGCAYGYLVEALRERGVEAWGIDISEYAVGHASETIKPYIRVNSAAEPLPENFPEHFDLITSIEVLEHMTVEEGERALEQLCRRTDIFVFSSSDSDLEDVTHINVQRKEYWARIFAKQGFYRDVQSPAVYISNWADVYRRRSDIYNIIQEYEVILRTERLNGNRKSFDCLIYYDTGKGLNGEEKIVASCRMNRSGEILISFELPEHVSSFRYDPAHKPCILADLEVTAGESRAEAVPLNAEIRGEIWVFRTDGPQVMVQLKGERKITIRGRLYFLKDLQWIFYRLQEENTQNLCGKTEKSKNAIDAGFLELGQKLELLIHEKEQTAKQLCAEKEGLREELQGTREHYISLLHQKELESQQLYSERNILMEKMQEEKENSKRLLQEKELELEGSRRDFQSKEEHFRGELQEKELRIEAIRSEQERLRKELQKAESSYEELLRQHHAAAGELAVSREVCRSYENAFFWKCTWPARAATDGVKKLFRALRNLSVLRNAEKTAVSLKKNGLKKTAKKIKNYFSRKKKVRIYGENFELPEEERERQERTVFQKKIKFSILVPLYNTPLNFLSEMLDSVVRQTYSDWELCLADGSDEKHKKVGSCCRKYQKKDARIKYRKLDKNGGISENTNACIEMAEGDYIGLFDHDDLLHPTALYEMMCAIERENPDFLYTDEAVFEGNIKNIITVHLKPDYGIDTLRANNYICHFSVFRRSLLEKAGRFRAEYDGSQDHDLILRLTGSADKVWHISKVLYYWRSHPASVASDIRSKPYASDAGRRAVQADLEARGEKGSVENSEFFPAIYRVSYEIAGSPLISIIIPCRDSRKEAERCIESIVNKSTYKNYEILLAADNGGRRELLEYYRLIQKKHGDKIRVLHRKGPYNYAALNNYAVQQARGAYVVLMHSDTIVITPEWMEEMLMYAQRKDVGAVGAKLYYENDSVRHAGMILGMGKDGCAGYPHAGLPKDDFGYMGRLYYAQNMSIVSSACLMVKKEVYQKAGGFDEAYQVKYSDADFCMKVRRAGYLNVFNPYAELYHFKQRADVDEDRTSAADGSDKDKTVAEKKIQEDIRKFQGRWKKELREGDPYFNQNFALNDGNFTMKG